MRFKIVSLCGQMSSDKDERKNCGRCQRGDRGAETERSVNDIAVFNRLHHPVDEALGDGFLEDSVAALLEADVLLGGDHRKVPLCQLGRAGPVVGAEDVRDRDSFDEVQVH